MQHLLAWALALVTVVLIGYVIRQAVTGKTPLLSIRNVFLGGVIIFQLTSAATSYYFGRYGELAIGDPVGSGLRFLFIICTFLIIFNTVYSTGWFSFGIHNRIRMTLPVPGTSAMVILSLGCLGVAAVFELALKNLGLIGILAEIFGLALAAMAAGTMAWAWAAQPRNLALLILLLLVAGAASALAMFDSFGRRGIVSVMVACLWGAYHGGFKFVSTRRAAIPLTVIGIAALTLVSAFTSTRGNTGKGAGVVETVRRFADADIGDGLLQLLAGQDAAGCSLWVIENRPEPFPYQPLASVVYLAVNPIPRVVWEGKPIGLGSQMVTQSMVSGKGDEYSVGPGLVGHIVNDNPWIALPLYAILLGAWFHILDGVIKRFPDYPYLVLPLGIELGEILGVARGEMGFFLFRAIAGMIAAYFGTILVARALRALGFAFYDKQSEQTEEAYSVDPEAYSAASPD